MKSKMFWIVGVIAVFLTIVFRMPVPQAVAENVKKFDKTLFRPMTAKDREILKMLITKEQENEPTVSAMKTSAIDNIHCVFRGATGMTDCYTIGKKCPPEFGVEGTLTDENGVGAGTYVCKYDCTGIYPDANGDCDCPLAQGEPIFCPQ